MLVIDIIIITIIILSRNLSFISTRINKQPSFP